MNPPDFTRVRAVLAVSRIARLTPQETDALLGGISPARAIINAVDCADLAIGDDGPYYVEADTTPPHPPLTAAAPDDNQNASGR